MCHENQFVVLEHELFAFLFDAGSMPSSLRVLRALIFSIQLLIVIVIVRWCELNIGGTVCDGGDMIGGRVVLFLTYIF